VLNGEHAISFLNLIDAKIARLFRTKGFQPSVIRPAYQVLGREMNTRHPFAHASLATDGRAIIQRTADDAGSDEWIDAISKQRWFTQMSGCLSNIEYGADRMAARWNIAQGVQIDPSLSLGKPVIRQTGVATYVIAAQYRANDGHVALFADLFCLARDWTNTARNEYAWRLIKLWPDIVSEAERSTRPSVFEVTFKKVSPLQNI
jgi:uncharacterized protein (DUF433 family)